MLINEFWKIPFLRLILPFIAGIAVADYLILPVSYSLSFCLFFIALTFVNRPFLNHEISYHKRWIFGVLINFSLFFLGNYLTSKSLIYDNKIADIEQIIGVINEPPKISSNSIKFEYKLREFKINQIWQKSNEKMLVTIQKDSLSAQLEYGDIILIKGNVKEINNAGNPSEFDYKKYLARKHLHYKSFQNSEEWALLDKNKGNPLFAASYSIRNKLLEIYKEYGIKGEEFGLLAALTLGAKDYLSDEIIEAYSDSGAMHVLSVSGLHVGIIFIVLNQVLFFLRKRRFLLILQAAIIIFSIWFFAILTGLSPSVNRSAAMITFVIIGRVSKRRPSTYNSVAASAFILLLIEPQTMYDVGFQLSYFAVVSILFFQSRIYQLFEIKNPVFATLWNWTAVSIAAQIGTSVLSIYYFHQFPVYAVLTNLLVVPVSSVIMVLAIALLFFSFAAPLAKIIAWLLSLTINFLNSSTRFVDNLPLSTIEPISINNLESLLFHLAIIVLLVFIVSKNKKTIIAAIISIAIAFGFRDIRFIESIDNSNLTVFNTYKKSAFSYINKGVLHLYSDTSIYSNPKAINYLTANIMADKFISRIDNIKLESSIDKKNIQPEKDILKYFIIIDSIKFVYLMDDFSRYSSRNKLKVNYIILSKNASMDIESIQNLFDFDMLIVDASVPKWKQEVIKKDCQQMTIPFYNVSEGGAFIYPSSK
jgi:competence protein ComEC